MLHMTMHQLDLITLLLLHLDATKVVLLESFHTEQQPVINLAYVVSQKLNSFNI